MELFHKIAIEEYALALLEGRAGDSNYIKHKVYERYETELEAERNNR
jgi:hypothetical protein